MAKNYGGACVIGEVNMDLLKIKSSDWQTKNWEWSLRPPESISREFLSPGWNTKILDSFENVTLHIGHVKLKILFFHYLWAFFSLLDNRNWADYTIFYNERHECNIKAKQMPESQLLSWFHQRHLWIFSFKLHFWIVW